MRFSPFIRGEEGISKVVINVFVKLLALSFSVVTDCHCQSNLRPLRSPLPVAICCSCLKSGEASGEGRARYVQQTVEPGRSMSRIVSLYKSVSDNSSWPSACCWLFAHTHFTHSWGRHTFHALPGEPTDGHNGVALPSGEYRLYLTHSLQVALHTFKASMAAKVSNGS